MPLRRRLPPSSGQSRPSDGTREHNDSGNLSVSDTPASFTGSIESLPNNNSSSSSRDCGGGGGIGGGGRSSRSSSSERESTATDHLDHPVTPRAFSLDSARTADERLALPRPWSVAEPSRPSLDDAATDALAVRRRATFRSALTRIGWENSSLREQLVMRSTRSSQGEDRAPPVVAATAAPAPPETTALRNSQLSSATPTETASGGCGTARNGDGDMISEGSGNSNGNDNGNDNPTTPVAMPSIRPPMTVSEMVRERRHRQERQQQEQSQQQEQEQQQEQQQEQEQPQSQQQEQPQSQQQQREQEDAPQRISPPLPLTPAVALAHLEDAARGSISITAGGGRRLPRFRRHQRSGNGASTESTRESTESARRSTESARRSTESTRPSAATVDSTFHTPGPEIRGFRWGTRPSPVDPATDTSTDAWRIASDIQTGFSFTNPRVDRAMPPDASSPDSSMFTPSPDLAGRRFTFSRAPAGAGVDAHSNGTSNNSAAPMRRPRSRRVPRRRNGGWLDDDSDRLLLAGLPGSGGAPAAATNSDGGRERGGAGEGSAEGGGGGETAEATSTRQGIAATIHQLHKASVVGDLTAISRFIKAGGDLEAQSFCGRTALHYAAFYGHADVARALILAGANVCSRGGGNSTPLHFAAWGGNKRVVRLLLDYGADVEARDTEGNAPQAYSEDDELYSMLVDARRKPLPLPASALSEVLHARPFATLAVYAAVHLMTVFAFAALFLAGTGGGGRWGVLSGGSPPPAATSAAPATGLAATALRFSAALGGKAAAAASMKAGVSGGEGGGGVGSASVALFLSTFTMALLAGLAPALLYATGFKRRTQAYWRSMKDRDREIVHLRQREQAAGGWSPAFHVGAVSGSAAVAAATATRAHSGAAVAPPAAAAASSGGGPASLFVAQAIRNGGISRGEQAGQAVIERLSRLQAASAAAGMVGANPPGAGVRGLGGGGGGDGARLGPHSASTLQQLQAQIQGYHQALLAARETTGGGGGGGSGQSSNAARRCVQVAQ